MNHKIKLILPILFILAVILTVLNYFSCRTIYCIELDNLKSYKLTTESKEDGSYKATYKNNMDILRAEIVSDIDENKANQSINARITRLKGLFSDAPAPYPGMVSDKIVCDKKFIPIFSEKEVNNIKIYYFSGYLSSRMTFGTCTEDESVYKGLFLIFYCPTQKKMYQLELVAQKDKFDEAKFLKYLNSISCK